MSERRVPDPSIAIDLSRRKAPREVVRDSIVEARQAAAPYVTMTRIALRQLGRDRLARAGALVLACLALAGVLADQLSSDLPVACRWHGSLYVLPDVTHPAALRDLDRARMDRESAPGDWRISPLVAHGPTREDASAALLPPLAAGHPLGTDAVGRDVFARVVHGARTALGLGLAASLVLVVLGVAFGGLAGFVGGLVDSAVSRTNESLTAIPTLVLVLVVGALVPHPTTATLLWTIALTRWTELARLVRAEVVRALAEDYVAAARALGASPLRILTRHVLPNTIAPAIVAAAFGVAAVVVIEAAVDFLGAGTSETLASWGESMGEARTHPGAWWLIVFPGAALLATLVALHLVGEAARNALDPRLREPAAEVGAGG